MAKLRGKYGVFGKMLRDFWGSISTGAEKGKLLHSTQS
jgi:hypothetical protein